ncbi:MAG: hypothetical protein AAGE94_20010, partial [Acidobacteriota bacterium]
HVQPPDLGAYALDARSGFLRLRGAAARLGEGDGPVTFVGRRLEHPDFTATARLDFDPADERAEAGISLLNNGTHFDLLVRRSNGQRVVVVRLQFGTVHYESDAIVLAPGVVDLRVEGDGPTFRFSFGQGQGALQPIQDVSARYLSSETIGGFTGVYVGLYATGNGRPSEAPADYDWFEYMAGRPASPNAEAFDDVSTDQDTTRRSTPSR